MLKHNLRLRLQLATDYYFRCRILARLRRFLRPILRRPFPVLLVPTERSVQAKKKVKSSAEQGPPTFPSRSRQAVSIATTPFGGKGGGGNVGANLIDPDPAGTPDSGFPQRRNMVFYCP